MVSLDAKETSRQTNGVNWQEFQSADSSAVAFPTCLGSPHHCAVMSKSHDDDALCDRTDETVVRVGRNVI